MARDPRPNEIASRKPCKRCGASKPGGSGVHYCPPCSAIAERERRRKNNMRWQRDYRREPCRQCGGDKGDDGGTLYCKTCQEQRAIKPKKLCVVCGAERKPRARYCEACRPEPTTARLCYDCGQAPRWKSHAKYCVACRDAREEAVRGRSRSRARKDPEGRRERAGLGCKDPLPSSPLAAAVRAEMRREERLIYSTLVFGHDPTISIRGTVCARAGITGRLLERWEKLEITTASIDRADRLMLGLNLLWWEVFNEDTVPDELLLKRIQQIFEPPMDEAAEQWILEAA